MFTLTKLKNNSQNVILFWYLIVREDSKLQKNNTPGWRNW